MQGQGPGHPPYGHPQGQHYPGQQAPAPGKQGRVGAWFSKLSTNKKWAVVAALSALGSISLVKFSDPGAEDKDAERRTAAALRAMKTGEYDVAPEAAKLTCYDEQNRPLYPAGTVTKDAIASGEVCMPGMFDAGACFTPAAQSAESLAQRELAARREAPVQQEILARHIANMPETQRVLKTLLGSPEGQRLMQLQTAIAPAEAQGMVDRFNGAASKAEAVESILRSPEAAKVIVALTQAGPDAAALAGQIMASKDMQAILPFAQRYIALSEGPGVVVNCFSGPKR